MSQSDYRDAQIVALAARVRELEEREIRSEGRFQALIQSLDVGIVVQGPKTEILLCNPKALELLGLSESQLRGLSSFDPNWNILTEDGRPFAPEDRPVAQAIKTKRPVQDVVIGVQHRQHSHRVWLLVNAVPQLDESGGILQVVATFTNISAYRHAAELIREKERHIAELATPLVPLGHGVVLLPLIGTVDAGRVGQMIEVMLQGVVERRARIVMLDITGVTEMDSQLAVGIVRAAQAVRLLGAKLWLLGVRGQVAQELVRFDADLSSITTRATLAQAIGDALRAS